MQQLEVLQNLQPDINHDVKIEPHASLALLCTAQAHPKSVHCQRYMAMSTPEPTHPWPVLSPETAVNARLCWQSKLPSIVGLHLNGNCCTRLTMHTIVDGSKLAHTDRCAE